jgi:hypothetical protein
MRPRAVLFRAHESRRSLRRAHLIANEGDRADKDALKTIVDECFPAQKLHSAYYCSPVQTIVI